MSKDRRDYKYGDVYPVCPFCRKEAYPHQYIMVDGDDVVWHSLCAVRSVPVTTRFRQLPQRLRDYRHSGTLEVPTIEQP